MVVLQSGPVEIADHSPVSCHGMSTFIILVVILAKVSILSLNYVNLGLFKFPDIVKLYTSQLIYDHLINKKSSNLNLSLYS